MALVMVMGCQSGEEKEKKEKEEMGQQTRQTAEQRFADFDALTPRLKRVVRWLWERRMVDGRWDPERKAFFLDFYGDKVVKVLWGEALKWILFIPGHYSKAEGCKVSLDGQVGFPGSPRDHWAHDMAKCARAMGYDGRIPKNAQQRITFAEAIALTLWALERVGVELSKIKFNVNLEPGDHIPRGDVVMMLWDNLPAGLK